MSLLEVDNLQIRFGTQEAVAGVSFTLDRSETLAIVGESGSGKSLTALSILQLLPPGAHATGHIRLDGQDTLHALAPSLRRARGGIAGMVFQEPMTSLNPLHRIGRQVAEARALHNRRTTSRDAAALLARVGFPDAATRLDAFPHQLSGGQRQRVVIAMALANDPALLIADEPTTALDVTIQAQILDLLTQEKQARGAALLLISHDLNVVRRHADRVCVMRNGVIVEQARTADLFARPQHPYTRALIDAEPSGAPVPPRPDAPPLVELHDLQVSYGKRRRRTQAVAGVDLTLRAGQTVGLVGESGSGKSTIGQALLRLLPAKGTIRLDGQDIAAWPERRVRPLRRSAGIVFQDPFGSLSPRMPVGDVVAEGLRVHESSLSRTDRARRVAAALAEVGLPVDAAARYPHEFSGGQRQRIAIARALILQPRLLVLDEPTSALDRSVQSQIVDLLRTLQAERGLAYLFISHDLAVVRALAHELVVLRHGRVVERGPAADVFAQPREAYTRALMAAAFGSG